MERSGLRRRGRVPAHPARLALAALAFALAACAPAGPSGTGGAAKASGGSAAPAEIRVVATDFKFDPPTLRLPAGRAVTVVLDNKGSVEHDLHVAELNLELKAPVGQAVKATVTADKAGTYELDCTIPGHKEAGMKGSAVVSTQ